MPNPALVGAGHGGSEDYATVALWIAAEGSIDYGVPIEAQCLGNCGAAATIGTTVNGALIHTQGTQYDGTNESSLAFMTGGLNITGSNVVVEDLRITSSADFTPSVTVGSTEIELRRLRLIHNSGGPFRGPLFFTSGPGTNGVVEQCVISGGLSCTRANFGAQYPINNTIAFGANNDGFASDTGNTNTIQPTDCFAFNNGLQDYETQVQGQVTSSASEDTTGTTGLTGFTSAELVNFAGNDFRTRATSVLATAGTGPLGFVGAFLEASSGITVNAESQQFNIDFFDGVVDLTGEVLVNAESQQYNVTFYDGQVSLVSDIEVQAESQQYSITFFDATVQLSGTIEVVAESVQYGVTFYDAVVTISDIWTDKPKAVTNWTDQAKSSTIWTDK